MKIEKVRLERQGKKAKKKYCIPTLQSKKKTISGIARRAAVYRTTKPPIVNI